LQSLTPRSEDCVVSSQNRSGFASCANVVHFSASATRPMPRSVAARRSTVDVSVGFSVARRVSSRTRSSATFASTPRATPAAALKASTPSAIR